MRKTLLRARRVKGDLDLGLDSVHVDGQGAKRWAEIFTPGGLLPGGSVQGIYEQSATPNYRIGTRRVVDERVFRYARAGSVEFLLPSFGVVSAMTFPESAVAAETSAAGTYTVTCTAQAAVVADYYEEGWLTGGSVLMFPVHRIKSNTGQDTPGGTFEVTLYDKLVEAITPLGEPITLFKNQYAEVRSVRQYYIDQTPAAYPDFALHCIFVGVPVAVLGPEAEGRVSKSYYCWIQTWGPMAVSGYDYYGAEPGEFRMVFNADGSVILESGGAKQLAGYLLPMTYFGGAAHNTPTTLVDLNIRP